MMNYYATYLHRYRKSLETGYTYKRVLSGKTLRLDLDPMEARSRYGMKDEQEKTCMLQKGHWAKTT